MIEKDQPPLEGYQQSTVRKAQPHALDEADPSLLVRPEVRPGTLPGNERIRFVYPRQPTLRRVRWGVLEATAAAQAPHSVWDRIKRVLIGTPIPTSRAEHERLTKTKALAVLSSDVISSVAYATEAILATLIVAGSGNLGLTFPIAIAIVCLLGIVALSYQQTIHAYPTGGGSYIVAKDNLGTVPGLTAGASLLIDYVLTVSVGAAAWEEKLVAAYPALHPYQVPICLFMIAFITIANLRGTRESGMLFAVPAYTFVVSLLALIGIGVYKHLTGAPPLAPPRPPLVGVVQPVTVFLLLRACAAGCAAITGIEAVSNGVQAFRPPEAKNASIALIWMAAILGTMFLGLSYLSRVYQIYPNPLNHENEPTVVSMIAAAVVGRSWFFYLVQYATTAILVLAANTSYADFPRLGSLLARDRFLPRQLANLGDRLVFSNSIIILAVLSGVLVWAFSGDTSRLIPLYAVGVFLSFTLSQAGMVVHWWREGKALRALRVAAAGSAPVTNQSKAAAPPTRLSGSLDVR